MKKLYVLLSTTVIVASGCASTYQRNDIGSFDSKLATGGSVLVATPTNGSYGGKEYSGSGESAAQAVRSAFERHSNSVTISSTCKDIECLRANGVSADYLVVPVILHWEDRATEWSGKKDKMELKLAVFDGKSGGELHSTVISGKSKWATFGGDHPQDLLNEPVNEYVSSLY